MSTVKLTLSSHHSTVIIVLENKP